MEVIVQVPKDENFAPTFRLLDNPHNLTTINCGGISEALESAADKMSVNDIFMHMFYTHLDESKPSVKVEVKCLPYVVKNYNGYTIFWTTSQKVVDSSSVMSIEDYVKWRDAHTARYVDNTWVYTKKKV
jgi:hypothetical protein